MEEVKDKVENGREDMNQNGETQEDVFGKGVLVELGQGKQGQTLDGMRHIYQDRNNTTWKL